MRALVVVATGPFATVQDLGRAGQAALGVGVSGAADRAALRLGNRLVGNEEGAAGIEATLGGLVVRANGDLVVALTGAPCPATAGGVPVAANAPVRLPAGAELALGAPPAGLRSYLAVRGGVDVPPVLGSRSTDTLAGLGPAALTAGGELPVGPPPARQPNVDLAPVPAPAAGEVRLRVLRGPRDDWFTDESLDRLTGSSYVVSADSDRVGLRLRGAPLDRARGDELPSEGVVPGAVQVPPSGLPTLFLADAPVTGGYPVVAVVLDADLDLAGQLRPGQPVRFSGSP